VPGAYVYIVSNKSHRLYVGWTTDLLQRSHEHKSKSYLIQEKNPNWLDLTPRLHWSSILI